MAKPQRKSYTVTLPNSTAHIIRELGCGRLSVGIELLVRDHQNGKTTKAADKRSTKADPAYNDPYSRALLELDKLNEADYRGVCSLRHVLAQGWREIDPRELAQYDISMQTLIDSVVPGEHYLIYDQADVLTPEREAEMDREAELAQARREAEVAALLIGWDDDDVAVTTQPHVIDVVATVTD